MKRALLLPILFAVVLIFSVPVLAGAADPLVPCNGPECKACDLVSLAQNVLRWLILVMVGVIALVFAIGGFKMVMSGGNPGTVSSARGMMANSVIGFLILLSGWLVVDTVMKNVVKSTIFGEGTKYGPWNQIQCTEAPPIPPPTQPAPGTPPPAGACSTQCASIPQGITIKTGACSGTGPCTVSSEISTQLGSLDQGLDSANINWQITEAFPPTRVHQNACHQNGTCVDANFTGGTPPTAANVAAFINQASASGLRAVYEVKTQAEKDALVSGGVNASNVQVLGNWISAAHFSVYKGGGGG